MLYFIFDFMIIQLFIFYLFIFYAGKLQDSFLLNGFSIYRNDIDEYNDITKDNDNEIETKNSGDKNNINIYDSNIESKNVYGTRTDFPQRDLNDLFINSLHKYFYSHNTSTHSSLPHALLDVTSTYVQESTSTYELPSLPPVWINFLSSMSICMYESGSSVRSLYEQMQEIGLINKNQRAINTFLGGFSKTEGTNFVDDRGWIDAADSIIAEVIERKY